MHVRSALYLVRALILQRPYSDPTDPTETPQRPYKRPYRDPTAYFYILKDQESRLGIQGGYIRTLPKGLRIPRTLRETAIGSDADVPGGASEACGSDQPRVWGINEPYRDPTATLQRPYSDPTTTLQRPYRPYRDPTETLQDPTSDPTETLHCTSGERQQG